MSDIIPVTKDEDRELPIPSVWRKTFSDIVEAFKQGDYALKQSVRGVSPIEQSEAQCIADNIEDYGEALVSLPEDTWKTSVYRWQRGYWEVLVDLFTVGGVSDLVLFARAFEGQDEMHRYRFEIDSVHVP